MFPAIALLLLQGFGRGAPAAPAAPDALSPVHDQVLLQQVLVWEGDADAVTRREDLLFRRGQLVLRGVLDPAAWPEAKVVVAEESWILYPAFLHADYPATLAEAPANSFRSAATDPATGPLPEMEYGARTMFAAHLRASDLVDWKNAEGKDWREAGFSRVQILPTRGLLQGRGAVAALSQLPLGDAVLLRDGLEVRSLRAGGGGGGRAGEFGYPSTPMAALAVHRQLITDQALRVTQGERSRPAPDLELGAKPLWRARTAREVENLLDLMQDQPGGWILLGGREAWRHAERLKAADVAVLFVLDLEDAPKTDEDLKLKPESERPWWQDPQALREEQRREHQELVQGFLKLREAGVRCALVPAGTPKAFADDLKQLLDAGADADDLQRALSTDAAAILGLPAGEDAIVSRGPLDLAKPQLSWVFADGRGFSLDAPAKKEDDKEKEDGEENEEETTPGEAGPLAGDWEITLQTPMGEQKFGIGLDPSAGAVAIFDAVQPAEREPARAVKFSDDAVQFDFTVPEMDMDVSVQLSLSGNALAGVMTTPFGPVDAVGSRLGADAPAEADPGGRGRDRPDQEAVAADDQDEAGEPRTGHPAWPVQTEADRLPVSEWGRSRGRSVLLQNATLYRMDGSAPAVGDLLIVDGVIREVGGSLIAPEDTPVIDLRGQHLMPAVLDAHSHLALDSINEGTLAITAECRIADMIHPREVGIWRAAAGGTAVALALHGSANPIGGQAAVWELDVYANSIAELLHPERPRNIKFALGENVKQSNNSGQANRFPSSRVGVEATYRRAFSAAQDYRARRDQAAANADAGFRRDERLEVLAAILDGEIRIQCHSYRADEIQMFLRICREFGVKPPVFQHVLEGYKMALELAEFGAMASTFSDWWAYKYEVNDAIPWNVEILHKAGVIVSINSDSDEMIRRLNTEAGKALRYGQLSYEDAMATCTRNSAIQMGLGDRLGSLEPGKDGTITVYDAPPLSGYARCVLTVARGRVLYERNSEHESTWQTYAAAAAEFAHAGQTAAETPAAPAADAPATPAPNEHDWEPWVRAGRGTTFIVQGARIHDMIHPPFLGSVVARDGRIVSVLPGTTPLPALPGAEIVDGSGLDLYPGFLNCGDVTGLFEVASIRSARDDSEIGDFQPDLIAGAAVHADSPHIEVARSNGVAYVLVTPGGGTVRGQASLIQMAGATSEDLVVQSRVGLLVDFPSPPRLDPKKGPEDPKELAELDRRFDEALAYGEVSGRLESAGRDASERDLLLEALLPYARGERPLIVAADDAATLMAARAWIQKRKLQVLWLGARDGWKVAGFLGEDGARVITGPVHALPGADLDPFDAPFRNAWVLRQAGCRVALRTADPEFTRNLPYQAATAAAFGLGPDEAARVLTLGAAEVLGVDRMVGSIEPGKVATFFLCAGDPLDFGVVQRLWIGGRETVLDSKQSDLRERYLERLETR